MVYLDYNVSSGPFLSYEIEIGDGPGPKLKTFQLKTVEALSELKFVVKLSIRTFTCVRS